MSGAWSLRASVIGGAIGIAVGAFALLVTDGEPSQVGGGVLESGRPDSYGHRQNLLMSIAAMHAEDGKLKQAATCLCQIEDDAELLSQLDLLLRRLAGQPVGDGVLIDPTYEPPVDERGAAIRKTVLLRLVDRHQASHRSDDDDLASVRDTASHLVKLAEELRHIDEKEHADSILVAAEQAAIDYQRVMPHQEQQDRIDPMTVTAPELAPDPQPVWVWPVAFGSFGFLLSGLLGPTLNAFGKGVVASAIAEAVGHDGSSSALGVKPDDDSPAEASADVAASSDS